MNELIVLASETSGESGGSIGYTIAGVVLLIVAAVVVFIVLRKKKLRDQDLRSKYHDSIIKYFNDTRKNDYPITEIRSALSIASSVNDQELGNLIVAISNEKKLFREFEYYNSNFHAIDSELDNYPEKLVLENTGTKSFKLGIDKEKQKCVFVVDKNIKELDFKEVLSYEVYKQDKQVLQSVTKSKTKKSAGKAIVGGALFGTEGAVVGALTANTKTTDKTTQTTQDFIDNYIVYIKTSQFNDPVITIPFIKKKIETNSKKYIKILGDSNRLTTVLDYIISTNESDEE